MTERRKLCVPNSKTEGDKQLGERFPNQKEKIFELKREKPTEPISHAGRQTSILEGATKLPSICRTTGTKVASDI